MEELYHIWKPANLTQVGDDKPIRRLSNLEVGVLKRVHMWSSGEAPDQSGMLPQCSMLDEPLSPQEEMKDTLDQREPGDLCSEEEEDQGLDKDMEFRRRREMSQVMIHTDVRAT